MTVAHCSLGEAIAIMGKLSHTQLARKKLEATAEARGGLMERTQLGHLLEEHVELVALLGGKTMAKGVKAHQEQLLHLQQKHLPHGRPHLAAASAHP